MHRTERCPSCNSPNDPGEASCRVCHAELRPGSDAAGLGNVRLERVLGGEVYRATVTVASPNEEGGPLLTQPILEGGAGGLGGAEPLAALQERIGRRATDAGQRFKPYTADRPRKARTDEARRAVARQLESGGRAFRERHFDAAIQHLLKAISKDDGDPRSWVLLGESYLRLERPYKAAVGYLRALELDPVNDNAWLGLGRALRAMEDFPAALEVLDRTIQSNPAITEAWSERGIVLEALQRPEDAAKSFQKALELRPEHRTARVGYARLTSRAAAAPGEPPAEESGASSAATPAPKGGPEEDDLPDFADLAASSGPPESEAVAPPRARPGRIRTFVQGLDENLGGGVPWGHVVLVAGPPGTMKSSLVFSILAQNAAQEGLHGLYLSLGERTSSLLKQMGSMGLPLHVDRGSIVVVDSRTAKGLLGGPKDWLGALRATIESVRGQHELDLIAIDSLESLEGLAAFADRRQDVFRLFDWLRDLDVTSFVIGERAEDAGHGVPGPCDEDFLADGLIQVGQHLVSERESQRRLRVVKMRGTRHETGYLALLLDEGRFHVTRITG